MSNFKFLLFEPGFASFADVAIAAEKILHIDPAASILNCRRAGKLKRRLTKRNGHSGRILAN